jgi:hypothetical protein
MQESILNMLKIKLNTMNILKESADAPKGKSTVVCGLVDETYGKLSNRSDDIDLNNFFEGFDVSDKTEIGIELIRNELRYKKEFKVKWLTITTSSEKRIKIYFPGLDDKKSNNF